MDKRKKGTGIIVLAIFLFMIVAIPTGSALVALPEPGVKWHNPTFSDVTDVTVGDLTGNGGADVAYIDVLAPRTLSAVYGINGTEYWTNSSVSGYSIAVGDVDGDGKNEVVAGGWNNNESKPGITVFEDNGTFKFFYETNSEYVKDIELGDVDNDGVADIVACNNVAEGWIYAFNGTDRGNLTGWPQNFTDEFFEDIALGNLDGNPGLDIAAISHTMSPGTLYAFNSTGYLMWLNDTVSGRSVEIGDVDGDTEEEVVIGDQASSHVYVYNSTGALEYSFDTIHPPSEVELGDLDDDTSDLEIAVITGYEVDFTIYALDTDDSGELNELWNFSIDWTPNRYFGEGLAIGDVDGDNKNEVIALSDTDDYGPVSKVWAFDGLDGNGDGQGDVVWMYALPSHPNDVEVGDVDDDGDTEVIVGTNHEGYGSVYALFTKQPALEVNKAVWNPVNETWVKELTAKLNDTLRFNCTITNTGNCNLTRIRFWDVLDCSLVFAGNATLTNASGWEEEIPTPPCPPRYCFKPQVLHPYNLSWDPYDPCLWTEKFVELCPDTGHNHTLDQWEDNGDGRVSACDQLWLESYCEWYHVENVPYTLLVNNTETGESMYIESVLDYESVTLSTPNGTEWRTACGCKDRYTVIDWQDKASNFAQLSVGDQITLQNERTEEEVQYTVEEVTIDLVVSKEWQIDWLPFDPFVPRILEPSQSITIEYNATVVNCGVDNNTFVAKGSAGIFRSNSEYNAVTGVLPIDTWYYSEPAVVTITVPCPTGDAADATPAVKDVFTTGEDVYALGHNFAPNKSVDIYITPVRTWAFGDNISDYAIIGPINTTTDANGSIGIYPTVLVWSDPVPGQYHMVFDDPDGLYEPGVDLYDYFEVIGVAAVPLITPLGIVALTGLLSLVALSTLVIRKKR
jgi:uncharacterized repeat protein (TIGR01451 family)